MYGVASIRLRLVGTLNLQVSFAKEPDKRDDILQKRPIILRCLLIVVIPYQGVEAGYCLSVVENKGEKAPKKSAVDARSHCVLGMS